MGRSVTVLKWTDIQVLVKICSHSVTGQEENFTELNEIRHDLVESFLRFFQRWQPDGEMDDELRGPLVQALEAFAQVVQTKKRRAWLLSLEKEAQISSREIQEECSRIAKLLRSAMEKSEDGDGGGGMGNSANLMGALLIYAAAQGQFLASLWRFRYLRAASS